MLLGVHGSTPKNNIIFKINDGIVGVFGKASSTSFVDDNLQTY